MVVYNGVFIIDYLHLIDEFISCFSITGTFSEVQRLCRRSTTEELTSTGWNVLTVKMTADDYDLAVVPLTGVPH